MMSKAPHLPRSSTAVPQRPTAPPMPAVLCAIDPGISHMGYAVLTDTEQLAASGTWIPRRTLNVLDRHLWLLTKVQDLLTTHQPGVLAYEGFQWMIGDEGEHFVRGRPALERLIGGIQTLAVFPPYPVLMELLPSVWGRQLLGQRQHTKEQIAWAVNQRLGTAFKGDVFDNHTVDAIGVALVALDNMRAQRYRHQFGKENVHATS